MAEVWLYARKVFRVLAVAFIVVPIVEVWLLIQAGSVIGGWETFGLMILISLVGAALVRREGLGLLARMQARVNTGELPTRELVQGVLVAIAGALLLTPGFLTDAIGLVFLFPPTRAGIAALVLARYRRRGTLTSWVDGPGVDTGPSSGWTTGGVIDVGEATYRRPDDEDG